MPMNLLFDIGGTKMRLAIAEDHRRFERPMILPTPKSYRAGMKQFFVMADRLLKEKGEKKLRRIIGGVPGPVDAKHQRLLQAPHLSDWAGRPLAADLHRQFGVPVYLENDAALVGLGEAVAGAGKGKNIVAYLTVSTGVGGVRIVNGQIDVSAFGFEPGHQIVDRQNGKEWEQFVSGTALRHVFHLAPEEITDARIWDRLAKEVAIGLHNTILHWSPHVVVLGGSMIVKEHGIPIDRIRDYLGKILKIFPKAPAIKKAQLKDVGGLYGAHALLRGRD